MNDWGSCMNKDQIAIYLNEHPEFFNDYPELLHKIKEIDHEDLPLQPLGTLSIADRILKRAHDDKEHMRSQLEWFVEISQANEEIQEHLYEIERAVLANIDFHEMVRQFRDELMRRFKLERVQIALSHHPDHFIQGENVTGEELEDTVRVVSPDRLREWFPNEDQPTLNSELESNSKVFKKDAAVIKSEALIPIRLHGQLAGALCLGSREPLHFYDGLRTDYLERMAEKLGLAIDNLLLLESLRRTPVLDAATGLFKASYLQPVLTREFDRACHYEKPLALIKMHIDTPTDHGHTVPESRQEKMFRHVGQVLAESSRGGDFIFRTGGVEFALLLPGLKKPEARQVAERIRAALESSASPDDPEVRLECRIGVADLTVDTMQKPSDLVTSAQEALKKARENGQRVVTC